MSHMRECVCVFVYVAYSRRVYKDMRKNQDPREHTHTQVKCDNCQTLRMRAIFFVNVYF